MQIKKLSNSFGILRYLDAFGVCIQIKFNESDKHRTRFGGLITLVFCSALALLMYQSLIQIINKSNPNVVFNQKIVQNPSRFDLNKDNFSFVITILDENFMPFLDESIYTVTASFMYKQSVYDETQQKYVYTNIYQNIKMSKCNSDSFSVKGTENYFLALNFEKMYCIQSLDDLYLQGQFENNEFSVIEFRVVKCTDGSIQGVTCQDSNKIDALLSTSMLQVYYSNQIVQVSDKENPFYSVGQSGFWEGNIDFMQSISLLYINTYVEDDDGLFLEDINTKKSLIFNSQSTQFSSKSIEAMYKISLYLEKNKEYYYQRGYLKVPQALSQIGGIYNVLFMVGCLVVHPYSQMQLNRQLFNSTFSIQRKKKQRKSKLNSNKEIDSPKKDIGDQSKISRSAQQSTSKNPSMHNSGRVQSAKSRLASLFDVSQQGPKEEENGDKLNLKGFINSIKKNIHRIQIRSMEYFTYYFGCLGYCSKNDFDILDFGMKKISTYTDICFIVNKLLEIEKLKHLILNEEQIKLFEFIPKPKIDAQIIQQQKEYQIIETKLGKSRTKSSVGEQNQSNNLDEIIDGENKQTELCSVRKQKDIQQTDRQVNILSIQNRPLYEKAIQAQDAFNNIYKGNRKKTKIDIKLIQMLDQDLVRILNNEEKINDITTKQKSIHNMITSIQPNYFLKNSIFLNYTSNQNQNLQNKDIQSDFERQSNEINEELDCQLQNSPLGNYSFQGSPMGKVRDNNDDTPLETIFCEDRIPTSFKQTEEAIKYTN